jgi:hypothetical protein
MKSRKSNKIKYDFDQLAPIEVYNLVRTGKIKKFPISTWSQPDSIEYATQILRFLFEKILNWTDEDIKTNLSVRTFSDYRLRGLLSEVFYNSPFKALDSVYPGRFKQWEIKHTPKNFWTRENLIKALKWMFEEKLKWSSADIKKNYSHRTFIENGLECLINNEYLQRSTFRAIESVYPGRFKEWELKKVPRNFWTEKTAIEAVKWLIEKKLRWTDENIKQKLSVKIFSIYKLRGLLYSCFNDSPFQAISAAYPGRFDQKDFNKFKGAPVKGVTGIGSGAGSTDSEN